MSLFVVTCIKKLKEESGSSTNGAYKHLPGYTSVHNWLAVLYEHYM